MCTHWALAVHDHLGSLQRHGDSWAGEALPVDSVVLLLLETTILGVRPEDPPIVSPACAAYRATGLCMQMRLLMMWFAGGEGSYRARAVPDFGASQW